MENKHEALGLQLQAKYDTITPQGQERLTRLQAKRDAFRRDRLKSIPGNSLLDIPNLFAPRETPQQIQPKLKIGKVGDKYEQEADRVAAKVVRQINAPQTQPSSQGEALQRKEMPKNEDELQRKSVVQRQSGEEEMATTPDSEKTEEGLTENLEQENSALAQLCQGYTEAEVAEIEQYMAQWDRGTYPSVADSILDHASRKGFDPLRYLRKAHNFNKKGAKRVPPKTGYRKDGSAVYRKGNEFLIVRLDQFGAEKIVTYGVNDD